MRRTTLVSALCLPLLAGWLAGCVPAPKPHPPIPPIRAEQVPVPPRSSVVLIWQPGHYDWTGSGYAWVPGEWVDRAGHGTLWQDGYWQDTPQTSAWIAGHWL